MNTLIHYHTGAYGTFIEWLLTYLTDPELDDTLPFRNHGNSHNFIGNFVIASGSYVTNVYENEVDDVADEYVSRFADGEGNGRGGVSCVVAHLGVGRLDP